MANRIRIAIIYRHVCRTGRRPEPATRRSVGTISDRRPRVGGGGGGGGG